MEIKYRTQFPELLEHLGLKGDAVEVGVAEGRNAAVLISSPQILRLYLIDAWQQLNQQGDGGYDQSWHDNNRKEVHERIATHKDKAVILKGISKDMIKTVPDDSLIFAYIDGDHSFEQCWNDLLNIYPKVKIGGVIALHDYLNPAYGVGRAVHKFWSDPEDIHTTEEDGDLAMVSCWFIKK